MSDTQPRIVAEQITDDDSRILQLALSEHYWVTLRHKDLTRHSHVYQGHYEETARATKNLLKKITGLDILVPRKKEGE